MAQQQQGLHGAFMSWDDTWMHKYVYDYRMESDNEKEGWVHEI
jgi:hypothetical protein